MNSLCKQGHEQTPENTYRVSDNTKGTRVRCKLCLHASRIANGRTLMERQRQERANRVEDIEFLLDQGVSAKDVLARSKYSNYPKMYAALRAEGRQDLLAAIVELRK